MRMFMECGKGALPTAGRDVLRGRRGYTPACRRQGGAGFRAAEVGWQEAIDGLAWLGEGARGVFANVPGAQCEEDREESVPGHTHFA